MTLPRLNVLISEGLGKDTRVQLKLPPPGATSGQALEWCRKKISNILVVPCVYKIGLTADPMFRFYKEPTNSAPSCGHFLCHEKFTNMHVLYSAFSWEEASLMEAVLIESHKGKPGNRNARPGGEGRQMHDGPFFTYIVFKSAMPPWENDACMCQESVMSSLFSLTSSPHFT